MIEGLKFKVTGSALQLELSARAERYDAKARHLERAGEPQQAGSARHYAANYRRLAEFVDVNEVYLLTRHEMLDVYR